MLRIVFEYKCAYCTRHEGEVGGPGHFDVDHLVPQSADASKRRDFMNLVYSCHDCNLKKGRQYPSKAQIKVGERFVDPCGESRFPDHVVESDDCKLTGVTPAGDISVRIVVADRFWVRDALRKRQKDTRIYNKRSELNRRSLRARIDQLIGAGRQDQILNDPLIVDTLHLMREDRALFKERHLRWFY